VERLQIFVRNRYAADASTFKINLAADATKGRRIKTINPETAGVLGGLIFIMFICAFVGF